MKGERERSVSYTHLDVYKRQGTYSDMDGTYLYPSSYFNMQKPKVFKTLKGAEKHLSNLKNKVVFGKNDDVYIFKIIEWSENDLESHLKFIGVKPGKSDYPQKGADAVLVAHNAPFDMGFIGAAAERCGMENKFTSIDTVAICRAILKGRQSNLPPIIPLNVSFR